MACQTVTIEGNEQSGSVADVNLLDCNIEPQSPTAGGEVTLSANFENTGGSPVSFTSEFAFGVATVGVPGMEVSGGGQGDIETDIVLDQNVIETLGAGSKEVTIKISGEDDERSFDCGTLNVPESNGEGDDQNGENGDDENGDIDIPDDGSSGENAASIRRKALIGLTVLGGAASVLSDDNGR